MKLSKKRKSKKNVNKLKSKKDKIHKPKHSLNFIHKLKHRLHLKFLKRKKKTSAKKKTSEEKAEHSKKASLMPIEDNKKQDKEKISIKRKFSNFVEKSGISINHDKLKKILFKSVVIADLIISIALMYYFSIKTGYTLSYLIILTGLIWTFGFLSILFFLWLLFYLFIDLRIYKRRVGIEEVFPDFLQLTSANIRAGMPIDRALWHAIRPNFGVLAKEMENVAKQTMTGTPLEEALYSFSNRYDSTLLKRSISLLIEGLNAGGEIGELLDRISTNIQESKMMKKEMSASVTTYAIFITFASIVAAPFLLALSSQLLKVIESIISSISIPSTGGAKFAISFSKVGVKPSDFKIFAVFTLTITSTLSSAIVATIRKGNIKEGIRYIPIFILTSLILFFILEYGLGILLSGVF